MSVRRALRALSSVMIVSGLLLLADAGLTLAWQEPISALYAKYRQGELSDRLGDAERLTALQLAALERLRGERRRVAFLARLARSRLRAGDPVGRIEIRRLGIDFVVVEGTAPGDLREGPGHYSDTPLPGIPGTAAIAGHRTTYLAPFRKLDQVRPGDLIDVETPYARFTYRAELRRIVEPDAYEYVTARRPYDRLALTACHPLYSAAQRIVVFARLVDTKARGAARV
jgi:sortase A